MCTASWLRTDTELRVFFNRDEDRARERAVPPALEESDGVRYLAPRDGRSGGTWIAVSERGLALALLNRSDGCRPPDPSSRGRLIPRLAAATDPDDFAARLLRQPLRDLAPFRLAALWLEPAHGAVAGWDGSRLSFDPLPPTGLLCSSGLGDRQAGEVRSRQWLDLRETGELDGERLREFHRSHRPEPSAWSVCMHRLEAETVSYAEIRIGEGEVSLRYVEGSPCLDGPATEVALPLLAAASLWR
jgi:hypothetical protein